MAQSEAKFSLCIQSDLVIIVHSIRIHIFKQKERKKFSPKYKLFQTKPNFNLRIYFYCQSSIVRRSKHSTVLFEFKSNWIRIPTRKVSPFGAHFDFLQNSAICVLYDSNILEMINQKSRIRQQKKHCKPGASV